MEMTQRHRHIGVGTPLGEDVLLLRSCTVSEGLSQLFHMSLETLSERRDVDFDDIVGENITVRVELPEGGTRYFNGYVSRFVQAAGTRRLARYQAEVVPWLWFLTRTADCRIFQEKNVPDIVKEVLRDFGYSDISDRTTGTYREWDYCVQYRETAYQFISRLLEQEGIYYFFEHEDGKHTLVLADDMSAHESYPGYAELRYRAARSALRHGEFLFDWTSEKQVRTGAYALNDYDFTDPGKTLRAMRQIAREHGGSEFEVFDHPGEYTEFDDGERYARLRIEEAQADHELHRGATNARGIAPGCTIALRDLPREDRNREYLVTHAVHTFETDAYDTETEEAPRSGATYATTFTAIPTSEAFRPPRVTPKPVVYGCQTATVTGPSGDEIHTDEHGRVKVQFHWDRRGQGDENSSCWIRVAQHWAGKQWGAVFNPRIGQEVVVDFLEGDPDHPIVVGRVYNGANMPPYVDEPTKSTIKSNTSKGGGGFNELRFEDEKGKEQVFLHAQRSKDERVRGDSREFVGGSRHLIVKHDQHERIEGEKFTYVLGDLAQKVDGVFFVHSRQDMTIRSNGGFAVQADAMVGMLGPEIILEAENCLQFRCGGSAITLLPSAIYITGGPMVNINSGTGGQMLIQGGIPDLPVLEPDAADSARAGGPAAAARASQPPRPARASSSAEAMDRAAESGAPAVDEQRSGRSAEPDDMSDEEWRARVGSMSGEERSARLDAMSDEELTEEAGREMREYNRTHDGEGRPIEGGGPESPD